MSSDDALGLVGTQTTITRTFDAPPELVFQAWTRAEHVAQWFGPRAFTTPVCEVDARPGGSIRIHMRAPDGEIHPMRGYFEEVVPPERLDFVTAAFEDHNGEPQLAVRHTVTFDAAGAGTTMTMHATVITATPDMAGPLSGMEQGWSESFEKLEAHLVSIE